MIVLVTYLQFKFIHSRFLQFHSSITNSQTHLCMINIFKEDKGCNVCTHPYSDIAGVNCLAGHNLMADCFNLFRVFDCFIRVYWPSIFIIDTGHAKHLGRQGIKVAHLGYTTASIGQYNAVSFQWWEDKKPHRIDCTSNAQSFGLLWRLGGTPVYKTVLTRLKYI